MKHSMRTNLERYEGTCVAFGHTMRNLCLVFVYKKECECMKCMLGIRIERVSCGCGVCVCGGLLCGCKKNIKQKRKVLARYTCSV
jgi:hypothetical protein